MESSPKHSRRRWTSHAIGASSLALIAFLGAAAPEFLRDDFKQKFAPYNKWILAVIGVAVVVEIVRAIVAARANIDQPEVSGKDSEPNQTGLSTGDHNQGTFNFQGGNVTAANTQGNVVGRDQTIHVHNAPPSEPNRKYQLPSAPPDFTGREQELNELLAKLGQGVTISGMHGLGGVGKTALALKLAERVKNRFPDAQIYLDLQGAGANPLTPATAMEHVIRAYHPTAKRPESLSELSALYRSTLHDQRALLLMDNAKDREQVEPLIPPAGCALLVTSRQHFKLPGMFDQNLNTLPRADAIKLLLNIAICIGDHANEISQLCGDLPLALRVAAGALAERPNLTPADYARRLADAKQRLSHLKEVDVALNLSYEILSEEQRRLWRALSVFPQTFNDEAVAAVWEMGCDAAQDAIGDLMKWSLVEFSAENERYRLHDLARLFADIRLSEGEREATKLRHATHYCALLKNSHDLYHQGREDLLKGLSMFDVERVNIEAGQAWSKERSLEDSQALLLCIKYPISGKCVLIHRQHPRESISWFDLALIHARWLNHREDEAYASEFLGKAYSILGDSSKAKVCLENALMIFRETNNRSDEGDALNSLGEVCRVLGETRKAIVHYDQALAISRETGNRTIEGSALTALGDAYGVLGETREAIAHHDQALAIFRETDNRNGEGSALKALGGAYGVLGETRKAIAHYDQALAIFRETGNRNGKGLALTALGGAYEVLGETRKAIAHYDQALAIFRETGYQTGEAGALGSLGNAYADVGEIHKAIEFYELALVIFCETDSRCEEGSALCNLGIAYGQLGETHKAIEYYEQALIVDREIGDRGGEGQTLGNLGAAWAALGETPKAIEFYEQHLAIAREIGDRRGEADSLWKMSLSVDKVGDRDKAIALAEASLKIREDIEDPRADKVRERLAEWIGEEEE